MQESKIQECFAIEQLKQLIAQSSDQVVIIDVRSPEEFAEKHIPSAINIPLYELRNRSTSFSKNDIIITTCGKGGGRSAEAATLLAGLGFSYANYLCGGTIGWFDVMQS